MSNPYTYSLFCMCVLQAKVVNLKIKHAFIKGRLVHSWLQTDIKHNVHGQGERTAGGGTEFFMLMVCSQLVAGDTCDVWSKRMGQTVRNMLEVWVREHVCFCLQDEETNPPYTVSKSQSNRLDTDLPSFSSFSCSLQNWTTALNKSAIRHAFWDIRWTTLWNWENTCIMNPVINIYYAGWWRNLQYV